MSGITTEAGSVSQITGWKDILMRAFKTAVATAIGLGIVDLLIAKDINAATDAMVAAAAAGATVLLNAILTWTQSD